MASITLAEFALTQNAPGKNPFGSDLEWARRVLAIRKLKSPLHPLDAPVHAPWAQEVPMAALLASVYTEPNPFFDDLPFKEVT